MPTINELQDRIVTGIDTALETPILRRFLSAEQKRTLRAQRRFWAEDDGTQLQLLLQLLEQEPRRADDEPGLDFGGEACEEPR